MANEAVDLKAGSIKKTVERKLDLLQGVPHLRKLSRNDLGTVWSSHPILVKLRQDFAGDFTGLCHGCINNRCGLTQYVAEIFVRAEESSQSDFFCQEEELGNQFPVTRRRSYVGSSDSQTG